MTMRNQCVSWLSNHSSRCPIFSQEWVLCSIVHEAGDDTGDDTGHESRRPTLRIVSRFGLGALSRDDTELEKYSNPIAFIS